MSLHIALLEMAAIILSTRRALHNICYINLHKTPTRANHLEGKSKAPIVLYLN
jgi:hypothetical protein